MSTVVLCQYFIQNDEEKFKQKRQILNAYVLPMKFNSIKEVRVADVKKYFPLNIEEYHFRFQTKIGAMKVWVDTSRDSVAVPNLDGAIKIKLLKLPEGVKPKELKQVPSSSGVSDVKTSKSPAKDMHIPDENPLPQRPKHIPHSNSDVNINSPHLNVPHRSSSKPKSTGDFDDHGFNNEHHDENGMNFDIDLDDILNNEENKVPYEEHQDELHQESNNDSPLLDFDTHHPSNNEPPPPTSKPKNNYYENMGDLCGLEGIDFNITNKQEEKKDNKKPKEDNLIEHVSKHFSNTEKEKEEWHKAFVKYDEKIKNWKGHPNPNSIKILLWTLHNILWKEANWKSVGMHELFDANSVKKLYRKAIMITHPDKFNKETTDHKFLANRVFGALNEAWKVYEQTGQ